MTAVDTKFLTWKDPYAWTEDMQKFKPAAEAENKIFKTAVEELATSAEVSALAKEFASAADDHAADLLWTYGKFLEYKPNLEGGGYFWRFKGSSSWKDAGDLDVATIQGRDAVVYTVETGKGTQSYTLQARSARGILWKCDTDVGSDIAVLGDTVYALEVDTPLRYNRLIAIDLETGKGQTVRFENKDDRWTLWLVRGANRGLFLIREQAGYQICYHIRASGSIERIAPDAVCVYPIGLGPNGQPQWLERRRAFSAPWVLSGDSSWDFSTEGGIEFATTGGIFITRNFGEREIWIAGSSEPVRKFWGNVLEDPLAGWLSEEISSVWVSAPGSTLQCIGLDGKTVVKGQSYGKLKHGIAISKDGLPVRWLLSYKTAKPAGLLVISYGGYGLTTPLGTARWKPWLDAGWAIGFALVRGGGDGSDVWASMGRLGGKENGIDDLEAAIVTMQEATKVSETHTVVYGRSAGGLMVGGIAGRHPHGGLARKMYAEVPYVDLLKTAGNPKLPLTPSEYEEFGNPIAGPAEFEQTMRSSPVHRLPVGGAPGLRVVCRTGFFDLQVYPYESLKWILALRGNRAAPDEKYLAVTMEGHFVNGTVKYKQMAEDFLLLSK
jgi:hypothetical protein